MQMRCITFSHIGVTHWSQRPHFYESYRPPPHAPHTPSGPHHPPAQREGRSAPLPHASHAQSSAGAAVGPIRDANGARAPRWLVTRRPGRRERWLADTPGAYTERGRRSNVTAARRPPRSDTQRRRGRSDWGPPRCRRRVIGCLIAPLLLAHLGGR